MVEYLSCLHLNVNPENVKIESSWKSILKSEFEKEYFDNLVAQLKQQKSQGKTIFPPGNLIFKAFELTPWDKVNVIILGQDPYHNPGEAMGLCFSVPKDKRVPPSLKNIYKEIHADLGIEIPDHGDLTNWAQQGVLLLNSILTVEQNTPGSHKSLGWQQFTDAIIKTLSEQKEFLVFMLWGNYAKSKSTLIDESKHLILKAAHPSPLARFGFAGCRHFSQCNKALEARKLKSIEW